MTIDSPLRALRPVTATYECTRHNAGQLVAQGARCCRGGNPDALHAQGEYVKGAGIWSNGTRSRLKALETVPAGAALLAPEGMQELPLKPAAHFSHFTPAKFTLHEH